MANMPTGKSALVFMHGSGSSGPELRSYLESIPLEQFDYQTFRQVMDTMGMDLITPSAASRSYGPFGGERANVWFDRSPDFLETGLDDLEDTRGAERSLGSVLRSIDNSAYDHIFIGGFSMGGGLALHTLRQNLSSKFRAIFAIGSYLVNDSAVFTGNLGSARTLPVMMMHGRLPVLYSLFPVSVLLGTIVLPIGFHLFI